VQEALSGLPDATRVVVHDDVDSTLITPARSLTQAIRAIVKNAIDASPAATAIDVALPDEGACLRITVHDRGTGMAAEVLGRVGEPFYTTKPPDRGMGLGPVPQPHPRRAARRRAAHRFGARPRHHRRHRPAAPRSCDNPPHCRPARACGKGSGMLSVAASDSGSATVSGPSLLIVDDDRILRERLARAFRVRGYDVRTADDFDEALAVAAADPPELALVDLRMPGGSGLELVRRLHALDEATRIVVLTGYGSIATAIDALRLGATHYLPKPADVQDVIDAFARADAPPAAAPASTIPTPSLARVEWEHINRVLADCAGNISEAARRLGMHRRSLQRKLQKRPPTT
jgi:two-component system response regulator RegA